MTEHKNASDWQVGDRIVFDDVVGAYHSNCEINGTLYKHPSGDVRILSVNNNYENIDAELRDKDAEIEVLKAQIKDPWCYDFDKLPSNQVVLVCFDLSPFLTAPDYSLQTAVKRNGELIDAYAGSSLSELRFIAFRLIPAPKGETE